MLADTVEQCSSHSEVARETETILDIALHALILLEVFRNEIRGFLRADPELLRKPERRLTVDDSEIHCFCALSLLRRDRIDRQAQHGCGCAAMDILPR